MSINKKTIEQLLEEALVPEEEQSYEIPENWVWVRFGEVAKLYNGFAFKSSDYTNVGIPIIRISDLDGLNTGSENAAKIPTNLYDEKYLIRKGDILIGMSGSVGKIGIYSSDEIALQNQRVGNIKPLNEYLTFKDFIKYYMYYSTSDIFKMAYGGTQLNVSSKLIESLKFPLPPINEQKRIAEKVERLLSKIEEAKQLIEEAKETFEIRRAAVLDKAVLGELTKAWRVKYTPNSNDIMPLSINTTLNIPKTWVVTNFQSIAADEKYSLAIGPFGSNLKVSDYSTDGVPLIFVRNIRSSNYELDQKFVSEDKAEELNAHVVNPGDILITKMGDPPGDSDICPVTIDKAIITADCIKLRVNRKFANNRFIMYAIKSPFIQHQIRKHSKGVAQQKITLKIFKELEVPVPHFDEQIEIVTILDKYMESNENIIRNIRMAEDKLEILKQSILSKTFRGELGTNDLSEENAIELLKEVIVEQVK